MEGVVSLSELLRVEMERRHLNQRRMAVEMGVPETAVSRWLNGQAVPSAEYCPRVASFLGLRRDDVMKMAGHWDDDPDDENGRRRESSDPALEFYVQALRAQLAKAEPQRRPRLVEAFRAMVLAASDAALIWLKIMLTRRYQKCLLASFNDPGHSLSVNHDTPVLIAS